MLVEAEGGIHFGTGMTTGNGIYYIELPYPASPEYFDSSANGPRSLPLPRVDIYPTYGTAIGWDNDASVGSMGIPIYIPSTYASLDKHWFWIYFTGNGGNNKFSHNLPWTWAVNDTIAFTLMYRGGDVA
jgi:hypothetical protein